MKKFIFLLFLFIVYEGVHPSLVLATPSSASGFIQGNIWYSDDSPKNGSTITIYTGVWNGGDTSLSVKVDFYDNDTYINSQVSNIPPQSLEKISIQWKVTPGDHTITAKIASSTTSSKEGKKPILVARNSTSGDRIFIPATFSKTIPPPTSNIIKDEVQKVSHALETSKVPQLITPLTKGYESVDTARSTLYKNVEISKTNTQIEIKRNEAASLAAGKKNTPLQKSPPTKILDTTHTPILYLKVFFLQILGFILGSKYVFYGIIAITIWILGKLLYQKVRNK